MAVDALMLGAPGVYERPESPVRALTGVRMDVAAFVGVAPRGPARVESGGRRRRSVAVAVESWDDYLRLYGGFEGAGRLPYAVASFFEQGGRRAYIVRIVHAYGGPADEAGVARAVLEPIVRADGGRVELLARNEGAWGDLLRATLTFTVRPVELAAGSSTELEVGTELLPPGSLVRVAVGSARVLRAVTAVRDERRGDRPGRRRLAILDQALPGVPAAAEVVEAVLEVDDGDGRSERHGPVGLAPSHPRWLGAVLAEESELVGPAAAWANRALRPADATLAPAATAAFEGGVDRAGDVTPDDFFDPLWTPADEEPGEGVHALARLDDLALLVVPDLYSPFPLVPQRTIVDPPSLAGPAFERCVDAPTRTPQAAVADPLAGLALDPRVRADRGRILALQRRLEELVELLRGPVALLDVPPGLSRRQRLAWRAAFDSSYVAAYHPWLKVAPLGGLQRSTVLVNPTGPAAGIVARRERRLGVQLGPWNELAFDVVDVAELVSPPAHDELHANAVNVFLRDRDGVRLIGGRTLSRDVQLRQLSVRRLLILLRRTLEQQTQWVVFEPNTLSLRADLRHLLEGFLRRLYRANAFRGATEAEAFFVRCDVALNPPQVVDAGRLVAEVGVAPAEPLEFLVIRIDRAGDGTLTVETPGG